MDNFINNQEQWVVILVEFDGCGFPDIKAVGVFSGPDASRSAFCLRAKLEATHSSVSSSLTSVVGERQFVARKIEALPD